MKVLRETLKVANISEEIPTHFPLFPHILIVFSASLTLRRLKSYIYGAPILDVSRSHTTTQHSR